MVSYYDALKQVHWEEILDHKDDPDRIFKIVQRLNPERIKVIMDKYGVSELNAAKAYVFDDYTFC